VRLRRVFQALRALPISCAAAHTGSFVHCQTRHVATGLRILYLSLQDAWAAVSRRRRGTGRISTAVESRAQSTEPPVSSRAEATRRAGRAGTGDQLPQIARLHATGVTRRSPKACSLHQGGGVTRLQTSWICSSGVPLFSSCLCHTWESADFGRLGGSAAQDGECGPTSAKDYQGAAPRAEAGVTCA
jgi:hypothetical protein